MTTYRFRSIDQQAYDLGCELQHQHQADPLPWVVAGLVVSLIFNVIMIAWCLS